MCLVHLIIEFSGLFPFRPHSYLVAVVEMAIVAGIRSPSMHLIPELCITNDRTEPLMSVAFETRTRIRPKRRSQPNSVRNTRGALRGAAVKSEQKSERKKRNKHQQPNWKEIRQ